jgi:hypothetical protein
MSTLLNEGTMRLVVSNSLIYRALVKAIEEKKSLVIYQSTYFDWTVANINKYGKYEEWTGNLVLEQGRHLVQYFNVGSELIGRVKKFEIYTSPNSTFIKPPMLRD